MRGGHRKTRAWNQNGVRGSTEVLIKLAWETALAKGKDDHCVGLLLSDFFCEAVESWNPTVIYFFNSDDSMTKTTLDSLVASGTLAPCATVQGTLVTERHIAEEHRQRRAKYPCEFAARQSLYQLQHFGHARTMRFSLPLCVYFFFRFVVQECTFQSKKVELLTTADASLEETTLSTLSRRVNWSTHWSRCVGE